MSFETHMKPFINPPSGAEPDFYIKGTTAALNAYLAELEDAFSERRLLVVGATVLPFVPPVTTPVSNSLGYFLPNRVRVTENEVKDALWCGDPTLSFINLFSLFGRKMTANFTKVSSSPRNVAEIQSAAAVPYVCNSLGVVALSNSHYAAFASQMIAVVKALGKTLTPEKFLDIESRYLRLAVTATPPSPVLLAGTCLSTNGVVVNGVFTGTLEASFASAPV